MRFFLGTHNPAWLSLTTRPLFISRVRLAKRLYLPGAHGDWALDSGGYTALDQWPHRHTLPPEDYAEEIQRYAWGTETSSGSLQWAAPQDWMCEPWILEKTGLTVEDHQERTVQNYLDLAKLTPYVIPVLQGYTMEDYERCLDLYAQAGVSLADQDLVGLGTVCRRQATDEIQEIVEGLHSHGLSLHGFGVKKAGLIKYGHLLTSADSMAWSFNARRTPVRLPGHTHKNCANCFEYAMQWGDEVEVALA